MEKEFELNDRVIYDPNVVRLFLPGLSMRVIEHAIKLELFRYNNKVGYYVDSMTELSTLIFKDEAGELEDIEIDKENKNE